MYLVGELINKEIFKSVFAVFDKESTANYYLEKSETALKNKLTIIEYKNIIYPFFIIEEFNGTEHYYHLIDKKGLKNRIEACKIDTTHFFNIWRMDEDSFNKNFPDETCLNGRHLHFHFTISDKKQIIKKGFESYWNDLLS